MDITQFVFVSSSFALHRIPALLIVAFNWTVTNFYDILIEYCCILCVVSVVNVD